MDLKSGIRLERPDVVVPWGITQDGLVSLLPQARRIHEGTLAAKVVWLGGLSQTLRFFFRPDVAAGTLSRVETGTSVAGPTLDFDGPFQDLQARLVSALGQPTQTHPGPFDNRYPEYSWGLPGVSVSHEVVDGHLTVHLLSIVPK